MPLEDEGEHLNRSGSEAAAALQLWSSQRLPASDARLLRSIAADPCVPDVRRLSRRGVPATKAYLEPVPMLRSEGSADLKAVDNVSGDYSEGGRMVA